MQNSNISAKILAHSKHPTTGEELVTYILKYPRFIHAELMTHRVFSRNAASSRAIPTGKMLSSVRNNTAVPEFWGTNNPGMQSNGEADADLKMRAQLAWQEAAHMAADASEALSDDGMHKQIANRVTEPFSHIEVLVTASRWSNFFALRAHKDAQPEFQVLAYMMLQELVDSTPKILGQDEWHNPFADKIPEGTDPETALKIGTARAARLSYLTFDGVMDIDKDIQLHDMLADAGHWSPFEHLARISTSYDADGLGGNFGSSWCQYRYSFPSQEVVDVDYNAILEGMPDWVSDAIKRNKECDVSGS